MFQATRAFKNAEVNLAIAKAVYLAETGALLDHFKAARSDMPEPSDLGIDLTVYPPMIVD